MASKLTNPKNDKSTIDTQRLENLAHELLLIIGEDPTREGLIDTPKRWAKWWKEFIEYDPGKINVTFESIVYDQMVVVKGIRVWSLCEHHLLPFWCDISMGCIVKDRVLGLSKFARIAHKHSHKLQIQERLVKEIAENVMSLTKSDDVAVVATGNHLCATMRGIKTDYQMVTSVMNGIFRDKHEARQEFLSLIRGD